MKNTINGIDVDAFQQFAEGVSQNPNTSKASFNVETRWAGQTRSVSTIKSYELCGKTYERNFHIAADEPTDILGTDTAPNPQELLMAALNACMTVGYVAIAASKGITVNKLEINTTGELDLRGFLGLDETVNPGYDEIEYSVFIDADATPEQLDEIHSAVIQTSPNFANLSRAIRMKPKLVVVQK